jgi:hypothetical protein
MNSKTKNFILNLNDEIVDVNIDLIDYFIYLDYDKFIINIKNHELYLLYKLKTEKDIDIMNYDICSHIFNEKELYEDVIINKLCNNNILDFSSRLLLYSSVSSPTLIEYVEKFKKIYSSMLKCGFLKNKIDPIILYRLSSTVNKSSLKTENFLALKSGKIRFFVAKMLGIKNIPAIILDYTDDPDDYTLVEKDE